jgi:hypothetical protein
MEDSTLGGEFKYDFGNICVILPIYYAISSQSF